MTKVLSSFLHDGYGTFQESMRVLLSRETAGTFSFFSECISGARVGRVRLPSSIIVHRGSKSEACPRKILEIHESEEMKGARMTAFHLETFSIFCFSLRIFVIIERSRWTTKTSNTSRTWPDSSILPLDFDSGTDRGVFNSSSQLACLIFR